MPVKPWLGHGEDVGHERFRDLARTRSPPAAPQFSPAAARPYPSTEWAFLRSTTRQVGPGREHELQRFGFPVRSGFWNIHPESGLFRHAQASICGWLHPYVGIGLRTAMTRQGASTSATVGMSAASQSGSTPSQGSRPMRFNQIAGFCDWLESCSFPLAREPRLEVASSTERSRCP